MVRYWMALIMACAIALSVQAVPAAAGCGKDCKKKAEQAAPEKTEAGAGCQSPGCGHKPCKVDAEASTEAGAGGCHNPKCAHKKDSEDAELESKGTVKAVDPDKNEIVVSPEGATEEIPIVVEKSCATKLKEGDIVMVAYEKKEVNVATRVLKQHTMTTPPKPCIPSEQP